MLGEKHHSVVEGFLLLLGEISPPVLEFVGVLDIPHLRSIRSSFYNVNLIVRCSRERTALVDHGCDPQSQDSSRSSPATVPTGPEMPQPVMRGTTLL